MSSNGCGGGQEGQPWGAGPHDRVHTTSAKNTGLPPQIRGARVTPQNGSEIHFGGKTMFFCVLPNWSLLTTAASGYPPGASVVRGGGLGGHRERASESERVYERAREFESFPFFTPTENNGCSAFLSFPSLARPQELPHHQQGTVTSRPVLG